MPASDLIRPLSGVAWNIFLATIPVATAFVIAAHVNAAKRGRVRIVWVAVAPLLLVWLLFLPNTCYLLTEWRHYLDTISETDVFHAASRGGSGRIDLLVMTAFYAIYTGIGMISFFLAIWPLDRLARQWMSRLGWLFQAAFFTLCSLGVYLGLAHRFNSWNVLSPEKAPRILSTVSDNLARPHLVALILAFGAFLWLAYLAFDIWMDGLLGRIARLRARPARPPLRQQVKGRSESRRKQVSG